jgi:hypothetical protein
MKNTIFTVLIWLSAITIYAQDFNMQIKESQKEIIPLIKNTANRNAVKAITEESLFDENEVIKTEQGVKPRDGYEWIAPFMPEDFRVKELNSLTLENYDKKKIAESLFDDTKIEFVESQKIYTVEKEKGESFKSIMEKIRKYEKESYSNIYKKIEKFSPEIYKTYYADPTDKPGIHKIPRVPKDTKIVYGLNYSSRKVNKLNVLFTATSHQDINQNNEIEFDEYTGIRRSFKYDEAFEIVYTYEIGTPEEVYFYFSLYDANEGSTIAEYEVAADIKKPCHQSVHEKIDAMTLPPGVYLLTVEIEMLQNTVDANQLLMEEIEIVY